MFESVMVQKAPALFPAATAAKYCVQFLVIWRSPSRLEDADTEPAPTHTDTSTRAIVVIPLDFIVISSLVIFDFASTLIHKLSSESYWHCNRQRPRTCRG